MPSNFSQPFFHQSRLCSNQLRRSKTKLDVILSRQLTIEIEGIVMTALSTVPLPDPIGGIWLQSEDIAATFTYLGQTYAFCCIECRHLFSGWPELYVEQLAHEPCRSNQQCPFGHCIKH
jgi:YHS domain-containing protein